MKPEIKPNLFDLSKEEEQSSKMMYEGKIFKCLVAPYHTYQELEKIIPYTKNTYLFPERDIPSGKLPSLVSMMVKNPSKEEFRIITTNQFIILDRWVCQSSYSGWKSGSKPYKNLYGEYP